MTTFTLITGLNEPPEMAQLITKFLEHEGFIVHHVVDMGRMMKMIHGRVNPYVGFVVIGPDETLMFSMYDVAQYLENKKAMYNT